MAVFRSSAWAAWGALILAAKPDVLPPAASTGLMFKTVVWCVLVSWTRPEVTWVVAMETNAGAVNDTSVSYAVSIKSPSHTSSPVAV